MQQRPAQKDFCSIYERRVVAKFCETLQYRLEKLETQRCKVKLTNLKEKMAQGQSAILEAFPDHFPSATQEVLDQFRKPTSSQLIKQKARYFIHRSLLLRTLLV